MKDTAPAPVHLADYQPFPWAIAETRLTFRLAPSATRVVSHIAFVPRPGVPKGDLRLDGEALDLIAATIDGQPLPPSTRRDEKGLTVPAADLPDAGFVWQAEVEIDPAAIPRWRGCTCRTACSAPSARPKGSAASPSTPTGPT
jgi:aminopeptidase N